MMNIVVGVRALLGLFTAMPGLLGRLYTVLSREMAWDDFHSARLARRSIRAINGFIAY